MENADILGLSNFLTKCRLLNINSKDMIPLYQMSDQIANTIGIETWKIEYQLVSSEISNQK
jgi:hypothetical protein